MNIDAHRRLAERLTGHGPVLLFGGTFDPPHRAHIELPLRAKEAVGASWLVYIPAARSPLKDDGPIASGDDRVDMLEATLEGRAGAIVSRIEIDAPDGPSYTVDTLDRLRAAIGESRELRLLIGADQARSFHKWREFERIIELAEPVVMLRAPSESREKLLGAMQGHWTEEQLDAWSSRIVDVPVMDVSATRIRELLEAGDLDSAELADLLPEAVLKIIRERDLYASLREG
jgi:nicotinate-nucleotide adenylyltransferase